MAQDAASGVNPVLMSSIAAANAVVQAGKVRPLAVTSATRFPGLPDLPALNESVPGVVVDGWFGVVAPAGTPADIVERVNREIGEFLKGPEIQQRLISFGLATERRRNAREHRAIHPRDAGAMARAGARSSIFSRSDCPRTYFGSSRRLDRCRGCSRLFLSNAFSASCKTVRICSA